MTITYEGGDVFKIKTKEGIIITGDTIKLNNFEIKGSGEYEVGGIMAQSFDETVLFRAEDINLTYLKRKKPFNESELEKVKDTDILFLSIDKSADPKKSLEIANQIEPRILIPMDYVSLEEFNKTEGISPETIDSLKITKNNLPEEERKVYILKKV